jgi:CRP/FNR family transcriptional regulator
MGGELIGLDAIASGIFQVDAVALESAQVCAIPFDVLQSLAQEEPSLQRVMTLEIVRKQRAMLLLRGTAADQRVSALLLDLAQRAGLLFARWRQVRIADAAGLQRLLKPDPA